MQEIFRPLAGASGHHPSGSFR